MFNLLAMIMAGGRGKRLYPLTMERAKPAVPFGGDFRIIDFALNNFINSGFYKIKVLTQFRAESLIDHIAEGWQLSRMLGHYVDTVPAQMKVGEEWYKGTADAIYQNVNLIENEDPDFVAVFGADHIYKMDVSQMLQYHIQQGAVLTIAATPVPVLEAAGLGVIQVNGNGRIIGFHEKPEHPPEIPGKPGYALVSMGNYIFNKDTLLMILHEDALNSGSNHDFGKNIIPEIYRFYRVYAYDFNQNFIPGMTERERSYWRDVGTIDTYYQASMDLCSEAPVFNLYNRRWPLRTNKIYAPPAKFVFAEIGKRVGHAIDSLVSSGCIISGSKVVNSILSPYVHIHSYAEVSDSILFHNVEIGRQARLRKVICDKHVKIPPATEIGYHPEEDRKRFLVSEEGITVIPKNYKF